MKDVSLLFSARTQLGQHPTDDFHSMGFVKKMNAGMSPGALRSCHVRILLNKNMGFDVSWQELEVV
jgi:hypothetical protein